MADAVVVQGLGRTSGETRALDGRSSTVPAGTVLRVLGPWTVGLTAVPHSRRVA